MCEFCTEHGDGKIWYKNAANYANDLVADLGRRKYIEDFFETTIRDGFRTLGRLEALFRRKGRLPQGLKQKMVERAKTEHFGQVLPMEEIRELMLKAASVVRMPCACRWTSQKKEARCCYGISYGLSPWYEGLNMEYFGEPDNRGLESLDPDAAVRQMEEMERQGAVHTIWTLVTPFIGTVCNCSVRDCLAMRTLSNINIETFARAEHTAAVDGALCDGCGECAGLCQFGAVKAVRDADRTISMIDPAKCFGCGLCRTGCGAGAISMVLR